MEILGMGPAEILVILVIALIVFGPGKLPEIATAVGRAIGDFRRASREFTSDLQGSVAEVRGELEGAINSTQADLQDAANTVQQEARALSADLQGTVNAVQREGRALSTQITAQPTASASASAKKSRDAQADDPDVRWLQLGCATEDDGAEAR